MENRGNEQSEGHGANPGCPEEEHQLGSGQAWNEDLRCGYEEPGERRHNEDYGKQVTPDRLFGASYPSKANQPMAGSNELQSPHDGDESQEKVVYS